MALHGPASVLDRRSEQEPTSHVVRDRLTRHQSPAGARNRYSYCSEDGDEIDLRIPQPYKTSFSAVAAPVRTRRDRSRSKSPGASSLKSSNRSRSKSPGVRKNKHVSYDEKVVIRDCGTSSIANLSDSDHLNDTSGHFSADSSMLSSEMLRDNSEDYSSQLRELSQQIVREYSNLEESSPNQNQSSQNRSQNNGKATTPNGTARPGGLDVRNGRPKKPVLIQNGCDDRKRIVIEEDYDHDRSISYRAAIKDNYSEEIKQQAEEAVKEFSARKEKDKAAVEKIEPVTDKERRNSLPLEPPKPVESNKLSQSKRSISSSIGNFFRRLSPHLGRKSKKGNLSNASSQSLSHGDDLDSSFHRHGSTHSLSRGKLRRSFMKLIGKSPKKSKSLNKSESSVEYLDQSNNASVSMEPVKNTPKSSLYMKSIEQSSKDDKDIYHKFKSRQQGEINGSSKAKAMKASPGVASPTNLNSSSPQGARVKSVSVDALNHTERVQHEDVFDARTVPRTSRIAQAYPLDTVSRDADSIGECSIDPNLTGRN